MNNIKIGDIVGRISYGKDIIFSVKNIISQNGRDIAILKGLTIRIETDAPIEDLELIKKEVIENKIDLIDRNIENKIKEYREYRDLNTRNIRRKIRTGKILHLDGDSIYSNKSSKYYMKIGLNAIVKNIEESKQSLYIPSLIGIYKPDILVITGHDGMLKKNNNYYNIYNYRNSRYFINSVKEARKIIPSKDTLIIFAGACQSYFEGIMEAGANFASSPGRILIDFMDPLIVAEVIATTSNNRFISINEMIRYISDGIKAVGGIGGLGKKIYLYR